MISVKGRGEVPLNNGKYNILFHYTSPIIITV